MAHVTMMMDSRTADALKVLIEMLDDFCDKEEWCGSCPTRERCDEASWSVRGRWWSDVWNEIEEV